MNVKKKLKRQDFMFQNGWFQTKIKKPKQLQMQQFQISDCEQCNIFLFDSNACVYIDSCKYCNIFIGPSQSSIFVRDCQSINLVSISQQFRVRDSFNCKFSIFCESQPIIQSSKDIIFCCYEGQFGYKLLEQQMKQAKLNKWNNNWFDIYDFTPQKFNTINYKLSSFQKQFIAFKQLFFNQINLNNIQRQTYTTIPPIQGKKDYISNRIYQLSQVVFLVVYPLIQTNQIQSLLLQSKYLQLTPQIVSLIPNFNQTIKKDKILFLKIRKSDQSRWKKYQKLIKIVKQDNQKQKIENVIFAPFKDQH